ncbi:hypothetical protein RUM43_006146 [Polyplax serrata]|uniref:PLAT domain-containing protein n=1 Tax=Polyplax serrata TaxID=468196 RepID=A0AAN8NRH6_POLSC
MLAKTIVFIGLVVHQALLECTPDRLKFLGFPEQLKRNVPYVVEIRVDKCPGLKTLYYAWEIRKSEECKTIKVASTPFILLNGYDLVWEDAFGAGYILSVRVSHYSNMTASLKAERIFRYTPNEMHIEILGGPRKTHRYQTDLVLNAAVRSRDHSFSPAENAFEGNEITWFTEPPLRGVNFTSLNVTVSIKLLELNKTYNFTLKVVRNKIPGFKETQIVSQIVTITSVDSDPEIECVQNCLLPHSKEVTVLRVVWRRNSQLSSYRWITEPEIDSNKIHFENGSDKLVLAAGAIKPNNLFTVEVINNLTAKNKRELSNSKSISSYSMKFTQDIQSGTCEITPKSGISGLTKFNVICRGFGSVHGIRRYSIYHSQSGVLLNTDGNSIAENMYLPEGNPSILIVKIYDNYFNQKEVKLEVEVKPFKAGLKNLTVKAALNRLILNQLPNSWLSIQLIQSRNTIVQIVAFALDAIDKAPEIKDPLKKLWHQRLAECIYNSMPVDYWTGQQILSIIARLESKRLETDTITLRLIGKSTKNSAIALYFSIKQGEMNIPYSELYNFGQTIFLMCSKFIREVSQLKKILDTPTPVYSEWSYDQMNSTKVEIWDDMKEVTISVIASSEVIGAIMLSGFDKEGTEVMFKTTTLIFKTKRTMKASLKPEKIFIKGEAKSFVVLPTALVDELKGYTYVDYQFTVFKINPFWWHPNASSLNVNFIQFGFFKQWERIITKTYPLRIGLGMKVVPKTVLSNTLSHSQKILIYKVESGQRSLLVLNFENTNATYRVTTSDCYCSEKDFERGKDIKPGARGNDNTMTIWHGSKNVTYICFKKITADDYVTYNVTLSSFGCARWNTTTGGWSREECVVTKVDSNKGGILDCLCKHTSMFTGQVFTPTVTLSKYEGIDFFITKKFNAAMIVIVTIVLLLWLILSICACIKDSKRKEINSITSLYDNVPGDKNPYLMVIFTGPYFDAGTTADVAFQVIGRRSNSRIHLLKSPNNRLLQRGGQDWILFYTPYRLGVIKNIKLWHNCKGRKPHWYCQRIIIRNLRNGVQYCFIVEKWFSLIWGSGKICHEIPLLPRDKLKSFRVLFPIKIESMFKNNYIWLNITRKNCTTNFSNLERVSCAFLFILVAMVTSAVLYETPTHTATDSIDENSYTLEGRHIIVALKSLLIASAATFVVAFLFQHSTPRHLIKRRWY